MVIAAGRIPPNPSEVLGSLKMRELIQNLTKHAFVIIDSPPLLPVTDAAVLATNADGAIVVVSAGKTTYDMMHKALGNLEKARARALGVVLNKVPKRGAGATLLRLPVPGRVQGAPGDREGRRALIAHGAPHSLLRMTGLPPAPSPPRRRCGVRGRSLGAMLVLAVVVAGVGRSARRDRRRPPAQRAGIGIRRSSRTSATPPRSPTRSQKSPTTRRRRAPSRATRCGDCAETTPWLGPQLAAVSTVAAAADDVAANALTPLAEVASTLSPERSARRAAAST